MILLTLTSLALLGLTATVALGHHYKSTTCRSDRCKNLRERMWDWYQTSGAECVREHEGSWRDPNPLYWGGFQANWDFHGYGYGKRGASYRRRWGTADHWPKFRQIHMAWRGHNARGWSPWPNTSRICGLR